MPIEPIRVLLILACGLNVAYGEERRPDTTGKATARSLAALSADVLNDEGRKAFRNQTWNTLQTQTQRANQRDREDWAKITNRSEWERFRDERLLRLRAALGGFPETPVALNHRITGTLDGDGFRVTNLVYQTRGDFWVTANLYAPADPPAKMPAILIAHSHHRPKTQGELQDMGMTWARQGCLVLVIDQVGHGERADHSFQDADSYRVPSSGFRWWRQDYYHRYDINVQLHLAGQSLMGWMVWDLMRGVDLLLERQDVDPQRIIILGSVAGGGDPAGVTAALDQSITAAVPFNFGGPQPETRFPLPADAERTFNYLGGAYWEGTRNLRRTGVDGFLHWTIVGSIAPRPLVYAHEFSWDRQHDPVWKRLNRLYAMYDAADKIDYTLGRGSVKESASDATHCTNIGRHHRQRIHAAFERWFGIQVRPEDEYSQRMPAEKLRSMTEEAQRLLKPQKLHDILSRSTETRIHTARKNRVNQTRDAQRKNIRTIWAGLLGEIEVPDAVREVSRKRQQLPQTQVSVERIVVETEPGIVIPMLVLVPEIANQRRSRMVVGVAQGGKRQFLVQRSHEIAQLLHDGAVVCLPDVRGAGTERGSRGGAGSTSVSALLFETPMLGYRLRDLRGVLKYLRSRQDYGTHGFALWGDSFSEPNPQGTRFHIPWRVPDRPRFSEPLGGLLAMLTALYEDDVQSVVVRGGLSSFQDVLGGPGVYIPHDVVVPGVLKTGDLADLAAAIAPCPLLMMGTVDGLNRELPVKQVERIYARAVESYGRAHADAIRVTQDPRTVPHWLLGTP